MRIRTIIMSTVEDIKKIYDTDFLCEYENEMTDTKYREEFLRAFRMDKFIEDVLINKQTSLLEMIRHERKFLRVVKNAAKHASVALMDPSRSDDYDFGIMMLYSFDLFAIFHKCICSYVNNNGRITDDFIENYNKLIKLLEN